MESGCDQAACLVRFSAPDRAVPRWTGKQPIKQRETESALSGEATIPPSVFNSACRFQRAIWRGPLGSPDVRHHPAPALASCCAARACRRGRSSDDTCPYTPRPQADLPHTHLCRVPVRADPSLCPLCTSTSFPAPSHTAFNQPSVAK